METRANYIVVGVFVLLFFFGVVGFVVWLGTYQFDRAYEQYDIYFTGNVSGLSRASPVTLRGIQVGEVIDIRIDPGNIERVLVSIQVPEDTPVKEDTVASIELVGITGQRAILLTGGTQAAQPLKPPAGQRHAVIPSRPSPLSEVLEGAPNLVERVNTLVQRATETLDDDNRAALAATLADMRRFAAALAAQSEPVGQLVAETSGTLASLRLMSEAFTGMAGRLENDTGKVLARADASLVAIERVTRNIDSQVGPLAADLRRTARALTGTADELRGLISDSRPGLRDFSESALYEFGATLGELRSLAGAMNRIATELERSPARFFFGNQQQGYETK